ncbi:MAG TPA: sugar ABC transporter permease [Actinobacteria bacterium]|nr:sugar ABC transporter permease [Actinomycetota bacterium]
MADMYVMSARESGVSFIKMKKVIKAGGISNYLYVIPALIMVLVFLIAPVVFVIYASFTDWDLLHPMNFVGLKNYIKIFTDPNLLISTRNTLIWVIMILAIPMFLGLILAVFIKNVWFSKQIKSIFYIPLAMSGAGIGIIWNWIFSRTGLLNSVLISLGVLTMPTSWLLNVPQNTFAMVVAATWQVTGLNMILFLMGLQNIQPEVLEAAKIDGANEWQTFARIILPLLKPITTVVIILNIIGSFKIFDIIWVMTAGGPARSSETLAVSMYKESFSLYKMGYGSSIAVLLSFIVFAVGIGYLRIVGREK